MTESHISECGLIIDIAMQQQHLYIISRGVSPLLLFFLKPIFKILNMKMQFNDDNTVIAVDLTGFVIVVNEQTPIEAGEGTVKLNTSKDSFELTGLKEGTRVIMQNVTFEVRV